MHGDNILLRNSSDTCTSASVPIENKLVHGGLRGEQAQPFFCMQVYMGLKHNGGTIFKWAFVSESQKKKN